jgi:hypothetical protein
MPLIQSLPRLYRTRIPKPIHSAENNLYRLFLLIICVWAICGFQFFNFDLRERHVDIEGKCTGNIDLC